MTKRELETRIEKLEKLVEELKNQPKQEFHYHYHYDKQEPYPYQPYPYWYYTTSDSTAFCDTSTDGINDAGDYLGGTFTLDSWSQ